MRVRPIQSVLLAALVACVAAPKVIAQGPGDEEPKNPWNDGLTPGNYIRFGSGSATPVSAHAALRYWDQGTTYYAGWENWDTGTSGVSRVGFSLNAAYSLLPLNTPLFTANFTPASGGTVTSISASHASVLEVVSGIRVRMPLPYVMPNFSVGLGLIDWQPGAINYQATSGAGKAQQQHRVSGEFTVGAGIDKNVYGAVAVFAEALYVYGYTSYGSGFAEPGGVCASAGCDAFRNGNTTLGTIRGGMRVRVGR